MLWWRSNQRANQEPPAPNFKPTQVIEIELSQPLPNLSNGQTANGLIYQRILALVRLHRSPVGIVELAIGPTGLDPVDYADQIWAALGQEIKAHLQQDGLPPAAGLTATGLPTTHLPNCYRVYQATLKEAPFVSVIIATHDRPESLVVTLDSLLAVNYPNYEIIVVDNAPTTAATANLVRQKHGAVPQLLYVREDRPGLAVAHNRGLVEAKGGIVAFTDDDVIVDKHWLTHLVSGFAVAETVGCVTGMIFPAELETPAQVWLEQFAGFSKGFKQRAFDLGRHRPKDRLFPFTVGRCGSGANMAFKRSALAEMGGFDPALGAGSKGAGGDDLAAFFEIISRGYTLVYEPGAIVHHHHRRDYADLKRTAYGYGVSLTAYLTKTVVDQPGRLIDLLLRMPRGVVYALSPTSTKNAKKKADYPTSLTNSERRGMLYGPLAYWLSYWEGRKMRPKPGSFRVNMAAPTPPPHLFDEVS